MFIDADKGGYSAYFHKLLQGSLLAKGGFIVADNVVLKGSPWVPDASYDLGPAIDAFNRAVRCATCCIPYEFA